MYQDSPDIDRAPGRTGFSGWIKRQSAVTLHILSVTLTLAGSAAGQNAPDQAITDDAVGQNIDETPEGIDVSDVSDVIDVIGERREAERPERPGTTTVIRPTEPGRADSRVQFRREAALTTAETGRQKASGYVVPRIRGQDGRLTEIWIGRIQLHDPYTGLPPADEIDLSQYGELVIHQGVTPWNLPSGTTTGAIQYNLLAVEKPLVIAGSDFGEPYGLGLRTTAAWTATSGSKPATVRVQVREYATDGAYRYYNDGGTPYNTGDDQVRYRQNNDRHAQTIVADTSVTTPELNVQILATAARAEAGMPAVNAHLDSVARETSRSQLIGLTVARPLEPTAAGTRNQLFATGSYAAASSGIHDPGDLVTGPRTTDAVSVNTRKFEAGYERNTRNTGLLLTLQPSQTAISAGDGPDLAATRSVFTAYGGLFLRLPGFVEFETKLQARRLRDRVHKNSLTDRLERGLPPEMTHDSRSASVSVLVPAGPLKTYLQAGHEERPPAVMAGFGNGGQIRPNPDIRAEQNNHRELGVFGSSALRTVEAGLAMFQDTTRDRISFVPSVGESLRAVNIASSRVTGLQLFITAGHDGYSGSLSIARLQALDTTARDDIRQLPLVAESTAAAEIGWSDGGLTMRLLSRYRSRVFRDTANSIEVPAQAFHDLYAGYRWKGRGVTPSAYVTVQNLTDIISQELQTTDDTGNKGRTSLSDFSGHPLPGRQWQAGLSIGF